MSNLSRSLKYQHPEADDEKRKVFAINDTHDYCAQGPSNEVLKLKSVRDIEKESHIKETFEEGKLVNGTKEAVDDLLNNGDNIKKFPTGVFCPGINISKFCVLENLGSGAFGNVDLCVMEYCGKPLYAVRKKIEKKFNIMEVKMLLHLEHPSIPKLYGYIKGEEYSEIFMVYAGMTLDKFVQKTIEEGIEIEEPVIWIVAKQMSSVLYYLAENDIMHMDVKPNNISIQLSSCGLMVFLIDFGSARKTGQRRYHGWTAKYMSTEMCRFVSKRIYGLNDEHNEFPLTPKSDMFSLGLVLQFLLDKKHTQTKIFTIPNNGVENVTTLIDNTIVLLNTFKPNWIVEHMVNAKGSDPLKYLLEKLLQGVPGNRFGAEETLNKIEEWKRNGVISCQITRSLESVFAANHESKITERPLDVHKPMSLSSLY